MASVKTILLGIAPSRTSDPVRPFSGRSGARLARLLDLPERGLSLDRVFELRNVLDYWPGRVSGGRGDRFPMAEARAVLRPFSLKPGGVRPLTFAPPLRGHTEQIGRQSAGSRVSRFRGRRVVLVGCRLGALVGLREPLVWERRAGASFALLPHPSGLDRWWNNAENVARAREFLQKEIR